MLLNHFRNSLIIPVVLPLLVACGSFVRPLPLPEDPQERALVKDVLSPVREKQRNWFHDKKEADQLGIEALRSLCRADNEVADKSLKWLTDKIASYPLPPEEAFKKSGRLGEISEQMNYVRSKMVLEAAMKRKAAGECPFWIAEERPFRGLFSHFERYYVELETGGRMFLQVRQKKMDYALGGTGRILAGYGFLENTDLLIGVEGGGLTEVGNLVSGRPKIVFTGALPFIYRWRTLWRYYDFEAGQAAYYDQSDGTPQFGLRTGIGTGGSRVSFGPLSTTVVFSFTFDFFPAQSGRKEFYQFSAGARGSFDLRSFL